MAPRVHEVEPKMGNKPFLFGKLAGADIHAAVNLHGIGAHHFPIEILRKQLRNVGLS